jgi:hypothetical protein
MEQKGTIRGGMTERRSQVEEQVEQLGTAVALLAEVHSNIEQRLGAVLLPCSPTCDKQPPTPPRPQMVPLAEALNSITEKVNKLRESMADMLSRIEL